MQDLSFENKRKSVRVEVKIPVRVSLKSSPEKVFDCHILDISLGGAFVHGTAPIMIGEEVNVEILFGKSEMFSAITTDYEELLKKLQMEQKPVTSVVRWARGTSNSGFGIEFVELTEVKKTFLEKVITHFSENKK